MEAQVLEVVASVDDTAQIIDRFLESGKEAGSASAAAARRSVARWARNS